MMNVQTDANKGKTADANDEETEPDVNVQENGLHREDEELHPEDRDPNGGSKEQQQPLFTD